MQRLIIEGNRVIKIMTDDLPTHVKKMIIGDIRSIPEFEIDRLKAEIERLTAMNKLIYREGRVHALEEMAKDVEALHEGVVLATDIVAWLRARAAAERK